MKVLRMKILNLTQHQATPAQLKAGVFEPDPDTKQRIRQLLIFSSLPTKAEIEKRARELASIADWELSSLYTSWDSQAQHSSCRGGYAMIGGAPYLMSALEKALKARGIQPLYAFSRREVVEKVNKDGSVTKTQIFKHLGFVEV